jgi:hypothetical protein
LLSSTHQLLDDLFNRQMGQVLARIIIGGTRGIYQSLTMCRWPCVWLVRFKLAHTAITIASTIIGQGITTRRTLIEAVAHGHGVHRTVAQITVCHEDIYDGLPLFPRIGRGQHKSAMTDDPEIDVIELDDMGDEGQRIVAAGSEIAGTFPQGLTRDELAAWMRDRFGA